MADSKLRACWRSLKKRCLNPKDKQYHRYGGRGIKVCSDWLDYTKFRDWALRNGYKLGLSIDRIDNDGDYCPENCRWILAVDNTRKSFLDTNRHHNLTAFGETKPLCEWVKDSRCQVSYSTLFGRLENGVDPEEALTLVCSKRPLFRTPGEVMRDSCTKEKELLFAVAKGESLLKAAARLRVSEWDREQIVKRWVIYGVYYAGSLTDHGLELAELWGDNMLIPKMGP